MSQAPGPAVPPHNGMVRTLGSPWDRNPGDFRTFCCSLASPYPAGGWWARGPGYMGSSWVICQLMGIKNDVVFVSSVCLLFSCSPFLFSQKIVLVISFAVPFVCYFFAIMCY